MILWVPSFLQFSNDEISVVQRGMPWSSYLMVAGVVIGDDEGGCCCG
ncbi:MAG: hypothetical protein WCY56_01950 [Aminobacteriaceae bacterium]